MIACCYLTLVRCTLLCWSLTNNSFYVNVVLMIVALDSREDISPDSDRWVVNYSARCVKI